MNAYPHLLEKVAERMDASVPERVEFTRSDRWIAYPVAKDVLDDLDQIIAYPTTQRPPCRLIVGRGDNGKTAVLRQFHARHPILLREDGTTNAAVVIIGMPATPDLSQLWSEILDSCAVTHRRSDTAPAKYSQVLAILRYLKTRVLAIDEFNNVVNARKGAADVLAGIRKLSNDLNLSIVAAGTEAAINALSFDAQMRSRFKPLALARWQMDRSYRGFLNTYEKLLPLAKPSGLAEMELASLIFKASGVAIGGTVYLIKEAAVMAIRSGEERITAEIVLQAELRLKQNYQGVVAAT
ncbi:transposase [Stenotrophomonas maltophilia]|uniref:TniB family NTP-binding protein n=1 Tax=Stenotrophomonas hibiscicola TaxID=86189 RepID=UPI000373D70F|nr:TniB family NTP-binding protein [[Pseudomonas] hibiscicola]PSD28809.1 transposase [Stenotrophomonas maltophilia]